MTPPPPLLRPMLAAKVTDVTKLRYPILATPKLDGIRCLIQGGQALTRALKPLPNANVRQWLETHAREGWDGELMLPAPATFQDVSSAFMSGSKLPPSDWYFAVFDCLPRGGRLIRGSGAKCDVSLGVPAAERAARLSTVVTGAALEHALVIPQTIIRSAQELLEYETECLEQGHEGVMVRDPKGPYKHGRSTQREGWLLKLKRFEDSEAEVIGCVELRHNNNEATTSELGLTKRSHAREGMRAGGVLGALQVRDCATGVEFEIGSGYTAAQKVTFWENRAHLVGQLVKYRHFARTGVKDKPRFPTFLGFRSADDM